MDATRRKRQAAQPRQDFFRQQVDVFEIDVAEEEGEFAREFFLSRLAGFYEGNAKKRAAPGLVAFAAELLNARELARRNVAFRSIAAHVGQIPNMRVTLGSAQEYVEYRGHGAL